MFSFTDLAMESKFKYPAISKKIAKENTKTYCTGDMQNVSFDEGSRDNEVLLLKHLKKKNQSTRCYSLIQSV